MPKILPLVFIACVQEEAGSRKEASGHEQSQSPVGDTVIFPLLSTQTTMSSLNFYSRELRSVVHLLESQDENQFIDAHLQGEEILVLKEDLRGNGLTQLQILNWQGEIQANFDLELAHHTIAPYGEKIAYLGAESVQVGENIWVLDEVRWLEPDTQNQGVLLKTTDVLDVDLLEIYFGNQGEMWDISHANTLRWNEKRQRFVLTFAGINAVWELDASGEVHAVYLGEGASALPYIQGTALLGGQFHHPHGACIDENNILWVLSTKDGVSDVQGYDVSGTELNLVEILPPPYSDFQSLAGGNVMRVDDGLVVNWGFSGVIEERSDDGASVWQFDSPLGFGMGFANIYNGELPVP